MKNKINKYKVSEFVKEDLPTWNEIYYDFLLNYPLDVTYDPEVDKDDLDKFWKIPRKLFILATVCNQLNKMVEEDNIVFKDIGVPPYHGIEDIPIEEVHDISFLLYEAYEGPDVDEDNYQVPIYTLEHPRGIVNPFIKHSKRRVGIDKFIDIPTDIVVRYNVEKPDGTKHVYLLKGCEAYKEIIDTVFAEVINYYKDEVGWKSDEYDI